MGDTQKITLSDAEYRTLGRVREKSGKGGYLPWPWEEKRIQSLIDKGLIRETEEFGTIGAKFKNSLKAIFVWWRKQPTISKIALIVSLVSLAVSVLQY